MAKREGGEKALNKIDKSGVMPDYSHGAVYITKMLKGL